MGLQVVRPFRHPSIPGALGGSISSFLTVLDTGTHTVTAAHTNTITLGITISDLSKVWLQITNEGSLLGTTAGFYYYLSSATQIIIVADNAASNLPANELVHYRVLQVPSGTVQRGSDTITSAVTWNEDDITLSTAIDKDRSWLAFSYVGGRLGSESGVGMIIDGHLKNHATDPLKMITRTISDAGTPAVPMYWQIWSPS